MTKTPLHDSRSIYFTSTIPHDGRQENGAQIKYKGDLHRLRVYHTLFSLKAMTVPFAETLNPAPGSFVVHCTDMESNCLNVTSQD
uniref:Uncharacterized protein n=1 Tax=Peronospora matthiolae TaxID=2874970 RepID=A0AAV1T5N9_9STRA